MTLKSEIKVLQSTDLGIIVQVKCVQYEPEKYPELAKRPFYEVRELLTPKEKVLTEKAFMVSYDDYDEGNLVAIVRAINAGKARQLGTGVFDGNVKFTEISVRRVPELDNKQLTDEEMSLWFLNNGYGMLNWTTKSGQYYDFPQRTFGDEIIDELGLDNKAILTYSDVDKYVVKLMAETV